MNYRVLNELGSFKAWGIGFQYEYDAENQILDITEARLNRPLIYIDVETKNVTKAKDFVDLFDTVTQLYALNLSNNCSLDLSELADHDRLNAMLKSISTTSIRAYYLSIYRYDKFNNHINDENTEQTLHINQIDVTESSAVQYTASYTNVHDGRTISKIQTNTLHHALSQLSSELSTSILVGQIIKQDADNMYRNVKLSTELSLLSAAINPNSSPIKLFKNNSLARELKR